MRISVIINCYLFVCLILFIAYCNCGGTLKCKIKASQNCAKFYCVLTFGTKQCGKRYLRQPQRKMIAKTVCKESTVKFNARQAKLLMSEGDPEPPHLFSNNVINVAKYEEKMQICCIRIHYLHYSY